MQIFQEIDKNGKITLLKIEKKIKQLLHLYNINIHTTLRKNL